MDIDRSALDRSPRKQPIVQQAHKELLRLHPLLSRDASSTAERILARLIDFQCQYTDHFLRFVQDEERKREEEVEQEEALRAAAARNAKPGQPVTGRQLRRTVGPLVKLETRLVEAMAAAEADMTAFNDMDEMSLSLDNRKSLGGAYVPPTSPWEPRSFSPSKRCCGRDSSEHDCPTQKRQRAIAAAALEVTGVGVRSSVRIAPQPTVIIPESPPTPTQKRSDDSTPLHTPTHCHVKPITSAEPPSAIKKLYKHETTPRAEPIPTDVAQKAAWVPPRPKGEDERYLLVTPLHSNQAHLNKYVPFHTQFELAHLIARSNKIKWSDVGFEDLAPLHAKTTVSGPKVVEVVRQIEQRTRMQQSLKRTFSRANSSTVSISLATPPTEGNDRQMQRIRKEAEIEEADIHAGTPGSGPSTRERPYGGQITYSFLIEKATDIDQRVRLLPPPPPVSPITSMYRQSPRRSHQPAPRPSTPGPTDTPDNPLGIMSDTRTTDFPFSMTIQAPRMAGKSFRLARAFGSRRVLSFKISKKLRGERGKVREMLEGRVLLVLGRTYRAFWATPEGDNVFAVETGDEMPSGWKRPEGAVMRSFMEIMARFNDPRLKPGQAMAKWSARPQLLFSDTVPACHVPAGAVTVIRDVVASCAANSNDPATEEILTDGCGLMSRKLAEAVRHYLQRIGLSPLARMPSAIQMRYGGSKGLLLLMSDDQEALYPGKDIVLRDSMIKSYADPMYANIPSMLMLDLVQHSSTAFKLGTSISAEPMTIMQERGVRRSVFVALQKAKLDEIGQMLAPVPQLLEDGSGLETEGEMLSRLRRNAYALGGVGMDRQKRTMIASGMSLKVAGLKGREASSDGIEEEEEIWDSEGEEGASEVSGLTRSSVISSADTAAFEINPLNGMPSSPAEALYEALSSGFTLSSPFVRDKLRALVRRLTDTIVRTFRIPIERSLTAFIVPDPTGLLAPDEIHISLSQPFTDPETFQSVISIIGPVLALRSPCKLPTDVQKMQAVHIPQLAHLTDVIVMSADAARCLRSPASLLGGGDYDGDTVQIIWEPVLVEPFRNADPRLADTPEGFVRDNFEKELVSVKDVLQATGDMASEAGISAMQRFLLGGIQGDTLTGKYSELHGNAVYELGVSHPETMRLARMFCHVYDARKSGLTVKRSVMKADEQRWAGKLDWRDFKKGRTDADIDSRPARKRPTKMGTFILDELQEQGHRHAQTVMSTFPKPEDVSVTAELQILAGPWNALQLSLDPMKIKAEWQAAASHAPTSSDVMFDSIIQDVLRIEQHVCAVIKTYELTRRNPDPSISIEGIYESFIDAANSAAIGLDADTGLPIIGKGVAERALPRSGAGTPSRIRGKPDAYRTKEDKKRDSGRRRLVENRVLRLWYSLQPEQVPGVLMGQGKERLGELMVARAAAMGQWAKHLNFLFEMDFETTCRLMAEASSTTGDTASGLGTTRAVIRKREAWEESKPSAKRGRF